MFKALYEIVCYSIRRTKISSANTRVTRAQKLAEKSSGGSEEQDAESEKDSFRMTIGTGSHKYPKKLVDKTSHEEINEAILRLQAVLCTLTLLMAVIQ